MLKVDELIERLEEGHEALENPNREFTFKLVEVKLLYSISKSLDQLREELDRIGTEVSAVGMEK